MANLLFIRHAHSVSQIDNTIVVGRAPECELTELGKEQANKIALELRNYKPQKIYTSPYVRAKRTAAIIAQEIKCPIIECEFLRERSQGDFEGKLKTEVYTDEIIKIIHSQQYLWCPPKAESLKDVSDRLKKFFEIILSEDPDGDFLVVTHLMVLWALFYLCTGCCHKILPHLKVDNTGLVEIKLTSLDDIKLIRWNALLKLS